MGRRYGSIGRREFLVGAGALGFSAFVAYLWTGLEPGQGRVTAKELTAESDTLLYQSAETDRTTGLIEDLASDDISEMFVSEHLDTLLSEYGPLEYHLRIESTETGNEEWFETPDVSVFDAVDVGEYVTYQVSFVDRGSISSVTCVASQRAELQTHCEYESVEVLE